MPNLAQFHPQIVHFVVVLMLVGVAFRLISLTGKFKFTDHAAATLLIGAFFAAWFAVQSGTDAHGPVERIPGARMAVQVHEEDAKDAKNVFALVALIEAVALGFAWRGGSAARYVKFAHYASAAVGIWACAEVYEASEAGGALVYSYAGGPGLRTGNPADVERLLLAGLYNQSRNDRKDGKLADAAALNAEMAKRFPADTTVQFLMVESLLLDSKNPKAALDAAGKIGVDAKDARWRARQANLKADAWIALGKRDSAHAVIAEVSGAFPSNARLKARLDSLK